jgi:aerobic-type carbon monoxide dehydrogenase small subunit (CoxS/CutS family)
MTLPEKAITLDVNGDTVRRIVEPRRSLADFLREDLELTGTHLGCEHGVCGACTVLLDGVPARACLLLAVQADGRSVRTVEGLSQGGVLHPVPQACWDNLSFQCAFCSPGFLMTAVALFEEQRPFEPDELREELAGNLCRCTGYESIVDGVAAALAQAVAGNGDR